MRGGLSSTANANPGGQVADTGLPYRYPPSLVQPGLAFGIDRAKLVGAALAGLLDLHFVATQRLTHRFDMLGALRPDNDLLPQADPLGDHRDLGGFGHFDRHFGQDLAIRCLPYRLAAL